MARVVVVELGLLEERDRVQRRQPLGGVVPVLERLPVEGDAVGRPVRLAQEPIDRLEGARRSPPERTRTPGGRNGAPGRRRLWASKSSPVRFARRAVAGSSAVTFSSSAA